MVKASEWKIRNIALTVEYDGTDFHGFAAQANVRTVQGELEGAIQRVLGHGVDITGAGRTDAGAHAKGQVVNFATDRPIPVRRLMQALNRTLPSDLAIRSGRLRPVDWSARFSALSRHYRYRIALTNRPMPFVCRYAMWQPRALDVERMSKAAQALPGEHDFNAFTLEVPGSRSFVRRILEARVTRKGRIIAFDIVGTAFLRGMVRLITGALVEIGEGKRDVADIGTLLNRSGERATQVAPACGLWLMKVRY